MSETIFVAFSWGSLAALCAVAGLFFLRFWRDSRERLFLYFTFAFWTLSVSWTTRLVVQSDNESNYYLYVFRLVAFLLIIAGIIDKNWRTR